VTRTHTLAPLGRKMIYKNEMIASINKPIYLRAFRRVIQYLHWIVNTQKRKHPTIQKN